MEEAEPLPAPEQAGEAPDKSYVWTPLLLRAQCGDVEGVRELLAANTPPDHREPDGADLTALHVATVNDHADVVRELVRAKADFNLVRNGASPLYGAAVAASADAAAVLLDARANPDHQASDGSTAIYAAALRYGNTRVMEQLIGAGCDVDLTGPTGQTPLFVTAHNGQLEGLRRLIAAKCEVDKGSGYDGSAPLFVAAQNGHVRAVRALLAAGARVDARRTTDGGTPVIIAAWVGHAHIVRELVAARCDVHLRKADSSGGGALAYASQNGHADVVRVLIEAGADVNESTRRDGYTPTCVACRAARVASLCCCCGATCWRACVHSISLSSRLAIPVVCRFVDVVCVSLTLCPHTRTHARPRRPLPQHALTPALLPTSPSSPSPPPPPPPPPSSSPRKGTSPSRTAARPCWRS
jgi:ankyrin repeat protein